MGISIVMNLELLHPVLWNWSVRFAVVRGERVELNSLEARELTHDHRLADGSLGPEQ